MRDISRLAVTRRVDLSAGSYERASTAGARRELPRHENRIHYDDRGRAVIEPSCKAHELDSLYAADRISSSTARGTTLPCRA